jgi:LDH2 family malate/lactate/ureidoglycolate dehydrogenase
MARISAEALERWTHDLLAAAGLEREPAATVAASLVEASLRGVDSHGVALMPGYLARIRGGGINRRPRPRAPPLVEALRGLSSELGVEPPAGV